MNSTPRWFWPAAFVPLLNVLALVAVHRYDRLHPETLGRWMSGESIGMALSLYVAFILLIYLLFLLSLPQGRANGSHPKHEEQPK